LELATQLSDGPGLHRPIKYRPDVDGLRAIAIASVVAYHARLEWALGGFAGVDVFFVISGYLIGSLVYKEIRGDSFSISKFYARRARRILPALLAVLLFCYAGSLLILPPLKLKSFSLSALATIASGSNFYFWHAVNYFDKIGSRWPLLMTWSLGVEEQFYLLFPMLMLAMRKMSWKAQIAGIASLAALSFAISVWAAGGHPAPDFYLLPGRAWELAAGVMLAMLEANRPHAKTQWPRWLAHGTSLLGLGLIGWAVVSSDLQSRLPGFAALPAVLGAVMLTAARDGVVNRALSLRPIVFIGLVSYSWYLWHWPLFSFARIVLDANGSATLGVMIGGISFVLAVLSYKFIERPFRSSTTPAGLLLKRYAAVLAVAAVPAWLMFAANGVPQRNRAVQAVERTTAEMQLDACLINTADGELPMQAPCVPPGTGPAVALIGDSHAGSIARAMRSISARTGYRLIQWTKTDCLPLDDDSPLYGDPKRFSPDCAQFNRERIDGILRDPHIQTVVLGGIWSEELEPPSLEDGYPEAGQAQDPSAETVTQSEFQDGLDRLVARLRGGGKRVYLVEDNPIFSFNPADVTYNRLIGTRRMLANLLSSPTLRYQDGVAPEFAPPAVSAAQQVLERVAAAHPGTVLVEMHSGLCGTAGVHASPPFAEKSEGLGTMRAGQGCRFSDGDQTLYFRDRDHLSRAGAQVALSGFEFR
jgi:peptidoglycan/LPS O-acetylase OafA/YrhL